MPVAQKQGLWHKSKAYNIKASSGEKFAFFRRLDFVYKTREVLCTSRALLFGYARLRLQNMRERVS